MCGRSRCALRPEEVAAAAGCPQTSWREREQYRPSHNVSPGKWLPVLKRAKDGQLELHTMKWGLVPSFTRPGDKVDHFRMFNARSESVATKPVFSRLLGRHRCVAILNGFYEWKPEGARKQPYYIYLKQQQQQAEGASSAAGGAAAGPAAGAKAPPTSGAMQAAGSGLPAERPMLVAGLWDVYRPAEGAPALHTLTLLTTDSSKRLAWLHDRMPVILPDRAAVDAWLAVGETPEEGDGEGGGHLEERQEEQQEELEAVAVKAEVKAEAEATYGGGHDEVAGPGPPSQASQSGGDGNGGRGSQVVKAGSASGGWDAARLVAQVAAQGYNGPDLVWHPVTPDMSNPGYDKPDACRDMRQRRGALTQFFKPVSSTKSTPPKVPPAAGPASTPPAAASVSQRAAPAPAAGAKRPPEEALLAAEMGSAAKRAKLQDAPQRETPAAAAPAASGPSSEPLATEPPATEPLRAGHRSATVHAARGVRSTCTSLTRHGI